MENEIGDINILRDGKIRQSRRKTTFKALERMYNCWYISTIKLFQLFCLLLNSWCFYHLNEVLVGDVGGAHCEAYDAINCSDANE